MCDKTVDNFYSLAGADRSLTYSDVAASFRSRRIGTQKILLRKDSRKSGNGVYGAQFISFKCFARFDVD